MLLVAETILIDSVSQDIPSHLNSKPVYLTACQPFLLAVPQHFTLNKFKIDLLSCPPHPISVKGPTNLPGCSSQNLGSSLLFSFLSPANLPRSCRCYPLNISQTHPLLCPPPSLACFTTTTSELVLHLLPVVSALLPVVSVRVIFLNACLNTSFSRLNPFLSPLFRINSECLDMAYKALFSSFQPQHHAFFSIFHPSSRELLSNPTLALLPPG